MGLAFLYIIRSTNQTMPMKPTIISTRNTTIQNSRLAGSNVTFNSSTKPRTLKIKPQSDNRKRRAGGTHKHVYMNYPDVMSMRYWFLITNILINKNTQ